MIGTTGAVTSAMHLADGLITYTKNENGKRCDITSVVTIWNKGCIELYQALAVYAQPCDDLFNELYNPDEGSPGVFDYDVSYEFGGWFGSYVLTNGDAPSYEEGLAELRRRAEEFFAQ